MAIIKANNYNIPIDENWSHFNAFVASLKPTKVFVIVDENTELNCLPLFREQVDFDFEQLLIFSGEILKNLESCQILWQQLLNYKADRRSLVINLGGGVIGDMGGFVAACFKRGIRFIQVPTTLLSMVDASVGGKLGVDFNGVKNIIGAFRDPEMVWIHTGFLKSLGYRQLRSGFAEVIKHALISDQAHWNSILKIQDLEAVESWATIVEWNVAFKNEVVTRDPFESGRRKILNFGHTIGHAIESLHLESKNPLLHGEAIALGMIYECMLSAQISSLNGAVLTQIKGYIESVYQLDIKDFPIGKDAIEIMKNDKKNIGSEISFTLLEEIGSAVWDRGVDSLNIEELIVS